MSDTSEAVQEIALDNPEYYLNRELSWLEFNRRVLEEAQDPTVPLMERLKFLAIFESNLDEFFMVRVGGLVQKVQSGVTYGSGADRTPSPVLLDRVLKVVRELNDIKQSCFLDEVLPALKSEGIDLRLHRDIREDETEELREIFHREIFPVLTPLAIDLGHPFPHLLNKSLNLAVLLQRPSSDDQLLALVQVPAVLDRFIIRQTKQGHVLIPLESMIRLHLPDLFPGMEVLHDTVFRVTRNSDFEIDDDEEIESLLKAIEKEVRKRRRGAAVRLQIESKAPPEIETYLRKALDLEPRDVHSNPSLVDLSGLFQVHALPGYSHLRDPQFVPQLMPNLSEGTSVWSSIRANDILLHHPYESFEHVVDFIEAAATDDNVLAIKQTLYRTSSDSPIVRALAWAAENGKQVTAVIELKARLDEESNILWARELEKAGAHVVYGFIGLKIHCKAALVVRRDPDGIRRYAHLASGNYNPTTARLYTDLGFFTCNPDFCEDVSALFNYLTGYSELPHWRKLVVAPSQMRNHVIKLIEKEIEHQTNGGEGRVVAKLNGLLEPAMVEVLYRASQAGVKIDLICRGICSLRPGVPGLSENIRVISIIDRYLEHSRIFYFGNGDKSRVYIGSADWMDRNLRRRVEVIFEIEQPDLKDRLINEILQISLEDNVKARVLLSDGTYRRVELGADEVPLRSQERFQALAIEQAKPRARHIALPERPLE